MTSYQGVSTNYVMPEKYTNLYFSKNLVKIGHLYQKLLKFGIY
jgi:hypothetical protein